MTAEHFDVLIVGAGLSGVGAAYRLQTQCPDRTFAILESRTAIGGTWDLFRYPGVRSDSDMFTLGYPFRPWTGTKSIADGPSILRYIRETAAHYGIDRHIRFGQRVERASWSSAEARWTVSVGDGSVRYTCGFLYVCTGYYNYEGGYLPDFPGRERYQGRVVHPQFWPEDYDHGGERIVVIGSGATAVTLLPALADTAAHVTMVQRSPSYVLSLPAVDPIAGWLRRALPEGAAYRAARWKNVVFTLGFYQLCRRRPALAKRLLRAGIAKELPDYDLDADFSPRYNPWDQRMCLVPDGDLFVALRSGRASIVTDHIETFTEQGIRLRSGQEIEADTIISATGLELVALGHMKLEVDGTVVAPGDTFVYRGFMLSGIPNLALCVGYTNASWTLRADLISRSVCRLLNHMGRHGHTTAVPTRAPSPRHTRPLLDLSSGYVQRSADRLPKQGVKPPWRLRQNYVLDAWSTRFGDLTESLSFSPGP